MSFILPDLAIHLRHSREKETLLERSMANLYQGFENAIVKNNLVRFKSLNLERRKIGSYCLKNNDVDAYIEYLKKQLNLLKGLKEKGQVEKLAILLNLDSENTLVVLKMLETDKEQQLFLWLLIYNDEQLQDAEELGIPKSNLREFRQEIIKRLSEQEMFNIKYIVELLPRALTQLEFGILENQKINIDLSMRMLVQLFEYYVLENNFEALASNIRTLIDKLPNLLEKLLVSELLKDGILIQSRTPLSENFFISFDKIKDNIAYLITLKCAGHLAKDYDLSPEVCRSFKGAIVTGFGSQFKFKISNSAKELLDQISKTTAKEYGSLENGFVSLFDYFILLVDDFIEGRPKAFAEKLALGSELFTKIMKNIRSVLPSGKSVLFELNDPLHQAIYWLEEYPFENSLALYTNMPFTKVQDFRKQVQATLCGRYGREEAFSPMREKPNGTKEQLRQFLFLNHLYLKTAYRERDHKSFVEGILCLFGQALKAYQAGDFASLNTVLFLDPKDFGEMVVLFEQDKNSEIYKLILNKYLRNLHIKQENRGYRNSDRFYSNKAIQQARVQQDRELVLFVQEIYKGLNLSDPPSVAPRDYYSFITTASINVGDFPRNVEEWTKTFQEGLQSKDLNRINNLAKAASNFFNSSYMTENTRDAIALFQAIFFLLNKLPDELKKPYCIFINQFLKEVSGEYGFCREDISRMFQLLQNGSFNLFKAQVLMNINWQVVRFHKKEIPHHGVMRKLFSELLVDFGSELKSVEELLDKFLTGPSSELQFDKAYPELVTHIHYLYVRSMLGGKTDSVSLAARKKLANIAVKYTKARCASFESCSEKSLIEVLFRGFVRGPISFMEQPSRFYEMVWDTLQTNYYSNNFIERALLPTDFRTNLYEMAVDSSELKEENDTPKLPTNPLLPSCQFVLREIDKASVSAGFIAISEASDLLFKIFAHHISIEDYRGFARDIYQVSVYLLEKYKSSDFSVFSSIITAIMSENIFSVGDDLSAFRSQKELSILLGSLFSRNATKSWNRVATEYYAPHLSVIFIRNEALTYIQEQYKIQIVPGLKDLAETLKLLLERPELLKNRMPCIFQKELLLFDAFARGDHKTLAEAIKMLVEFSFKAYEKDRSLLIEVFQLTAKLPWSKLESHRSEDHKVHDENRRLLRWCYHIESNSPKQIMIMILKEVFKDWSNFLNWEQYQKLEKAVYENLEITLLDRFEPGKSSAESPEELKEIVDFIYSQSNAGVDLLKDLEPVSLVAKKAGFIKLLPKPKEEDSAQYHRIYSKIQDIWHLHLVVHRFSLQTDDFLEGSMNNTMLQQIHDNFLSYLEQKETYEVIELILKGSKDIKQEGELAEQFRIALKADMQALFLGEKSSPELKLRLEQGQQLSVPIYTSFGDASGHLSAAVFFKLGKQWFMFKSDRGGDTAAKESGIILYKITKPEDIKMVAEKMSASCKAPLHNEIYKALLKDNLGLEKVWHLYKKHQVIGSCGFISAAKPLAEINCLVHMMKLIYQNNPDLDVGDLLKRAKNLVKPITSAFSVYDRVQILKDFIHHLKAQLAIQQYKPEDLEPIKILLAQIRIMSENRPSRKEVIELLSDINLPEPLRVAEKHLEVANRALSRSFETLLLSATELHEESYLLKTRDFDKAGGAIVTYYRTKQHVNSEAFGIQLHREAAKLVSTLPVEVLDRMAARKKQQAS